MLQKEIKAYLLADQKYLKKTRPPGRTATLILPAMIPVGFFCFLLKHILVIVKIYTYNMLVAEGVLFVYK